MLLCKECQKSAATKYNIPQSTLQRHIHKVENGGGVEKVMGRPCLLTCEQEQDLVNKILDMEARFYGLRPSDIRSLVYKFCGANGVRRNLRETTQMSGKKWMAAFMKTHQENPVRLPEKTSMGRAAGFNRAKVDR